MSRLVKGVVAALILIAVLLVGLMLAAESTWFSQLVARQASAHLDRQVTIDGPFDIDWSLHPRIQIPTLTIANAPWAEQQPLAQIASTELTLDLQQLFAGRTRINTLLLNMPRLSLQRQEDGRSNWQALADALGKDAEDSDKKGGDGLAASVGAVQIRNGRLNFQDASQALNLDLAIETTPTENGAERLRVTGHGSRRGHAFELNLRGGPLLAVSDPDHPYPIAGTLNAGKTTLQGEGELLRPAAPERGRFTLTLQGPNPADLHELLGLTLPDLPPYQLTGELSFENSLWHFRQFHGQVGDSDLGGDLLIRPGEPLVLEADLVSKRLDLDDLLPAIGAAPATGAEETTSAEQAQQAQTQQQDQDVLPKAPPDRSRLQGVAATVKFRGERINAPRKIPLQDMELSLRLRDGVLRFEPLTFGLGGGTIRSLLALDTRLQPVQGELEARMQDVDLGNLLTDFGVPSGGFGTIRARLDTRFAGDSIKEAAASSNGGLLVYMTSGEVDAVLVSLAGLDAGRALVKRFFGSGPTEIECAFTYIESIDGLANVERFLIATEDIDLTAAGDVNLRQEEFNIALRGYPRSATVGASDAPVHLSGKFSDAEVSVISEQLLARGALAALAALVAPPLAIVPFLNPGTGDEKEDVCAQLTREAQQINLDAPPADPAAQQRQQKD